MLESSTDSWQYYTVLNVPMLSEGNYASVGIAGSSLCREWLLT